SIATLFLQADNGSWGSAALGSGTTLQNSRCSLNTGASSASVSGAGTSLTVNFALSFTSAFAGAQTLTTFAADSAGWVSGFSTTGTWTVTVPPPPPAVPTLSAALTPGSGSGTTAMFALKLADTNGYSAVQQADLFIGDNLGGLNQCYIDYNPATRTLSL